MQITSSQFDFLPHFNCKIRNIPAMDSFRGGRNTPQSAKHEQPAMVLCEEVDEGAAMVLCE